MRPGDIQWLRAGITPVGIRIRKNQRLCEICGTWVQIATKQHVCDRPPEERGKRWRWCTSCQTYVRTSVGKHKCDLPPLEIPEGARWRRCRTCREPWPYTAVFFPAADGRLIPHCRACYNAKRKARGWNRSKLSRSVHFSTSASVRTSVH